MSDEKAGDKKDVIFEGAIPLGSGAAAGLMGLMAALAAARRGGEPEGDVTDHPLLKKLGVKPPAPFRAATKEEFLKFFKDWNKEQLKVGDIVEVMSGYELDVWPAIGEQAVVSQVLEEPVRFGTAYTEQMGRRNDVALLFVPNTDMEVMAAMGEEQQLTMHEFLYDSRRLKKVGSVFDK